jgi:hypothetical protein
MTELYAVPDPEPPAPPPRQCRSCGAPIIWAHTAAGKIAPFDAQPSPEGRWRITDGVAAYVGSAEPSLNMLTGKPDAYYTNHFATCPDRDEWRKPKGGGDG